jgi:hypothetical protein
LAILKCVEVGILWTATKIVGLIVPVYKIKQECVHRNGRADTRNLGYPCEATFCF